MARDLTVRLIGDQKSLHKAFDQSSKDADKFGKKLSGGASAGLGKLAKAGLLAGGALAGGLVAGFGYAAKAAIEAEKSSARLDATLSAMGKNTPAVRSEVDKMVTSVSQLGAFDDEDLTDAFSTLAKTTGSTSKALDELSLVADVARGANISLEAATKLVGKAATGQVGALKRYGIVLDKGASSTDALAALQGKFAGQAEAYGKTTAGAMDRAHVAIENLGESVGTSLAPAVAWLAETALKLIEDWGPKVAKVMDDLKPHFRDAWQVAKDAAQGVLDWYSANVKPTLEAVQRFFEEHRDEIAKIMGQISEAVIGAITQMREVSAALLAAMRGDWDVSFASIQDLVKTTMEANLAEIKAVKHLWEAAAGALALAVAHAIRDGLQALPGIVGAGLNAGFAKIGEAEVATFNASVKLGGRILAGIKNGAGNLAEMIGDKLGGLYQGLVNAGPAAFALARSVGAQILGGIKSGIGDLAGWVVGQVRGAINAVIGQVNRALDFSFTVDTHIPGVGKIGVPVNAPDIPSLASGGIVPATPGGRLIRAGEGGQPEAVVPLDQFGPKIVMENHFYGAEADPMVAGAKLSWQLRTLAR